MGGKTKDGSVVWKDTRRVLLNTAASRISYIQNAATYIQTNYPNLKVIIYAPGGKNGGTDWKTITGNCGSSGTNGPSGWSFSVEPSGPLHYITVASGPGNATISMDPWLNAPIVVGP
jgi:hypothetical protein